MKPIGIGQQQTRQLPIERYSIRPSRNWAFAFRRQCILDQIAGRWLLTALFVLILGIVTGCSSGDDDSSADSSSANSTTDDEDEPDSSPGLASSEHGSADDGVESELAIAAHSQAYSVLSMLANPSPEYAQTLKECMNAQGFDYEIDTPVRLIPESDMNALLEDVASMNPTSSLYRNRYGYGITTIAAYLDGSARADSNEELLDQMSDAEIEAWTIALHGPSMGKFFDPEYAPTEEEIGEDLVGIFSEPGGCNAEAAPFLEIDFGMPQEESEAVSEMLLQIAGSEEHVVLEQQWAGCAADEGFRDFTSIASVTELFLDKFEQLRRQSLSGGRLERVLGLSRAELDELSLEEIEDRLEAAPFRYTLEDLEQLQREELEFARRLKDCDRAYWEGYAELEDRLFPDG